MQITGYYEGTGKSIRELLQTNKLFVHMKANANLINAQTKLKVKCEC